MCAVCVDACVHVVRKERCLDLPGVSHLTQMLAHSIRNFSISHGVHTEKNSTTTHSQADYLAVVTRNAIAAGHLVMVGVRIVGVFLSRV